MSAEIPHYRYRFSLDFQLSAIADTASGLETLQSSKERLLNLQPVVGQINALLLKRKQEAYAQVTGPALSQGRI